MSTTTPTTTPTPVNSARAGFEHLFVNDELDKQITRAGAAKAAYDDWVKQVVADCSARNVAMVDKHTLQDMWVAHLKQQGVENKAAKAKAKLEAKLAALQAKLNVVPETEEERNERIFQEADKKMWALQEARDNQDKMSHREQEEYFGLSKPPDSKEEKLKRLQQADETNEGEI